MSKGPQVGKLISAREAKPAKGQHLRPCSDCPFARDALRGWLGAMDIEEWLQHAHRGGSADCHALKGTQCAGLAIYQKNTCVRPRDPVQAAFVDRVRRDDETVFSRPGDFRDHHEG